MALVRPLILIPSNIICRCFLSLPPPRFFYTHRVGNTLGEDPRTAALASDGAFEVHACLRCDEWQQRSVMPEDDDDVIMLATYLGEVQETIGDNSTVNPPPWYESGAV